MHSAVLAALVGLVVAAPMLVVLAQIGRASGGLWSHLARTVLPEYLTNTLQLALGVGLLTTLLGVGTAWLVTLCQFPARQFLSWALLLPLAIPAYLSAYAYTDLLQYSGTLQTWARSVFGNDASLWFPQVRSLPGAIVLLSLALYPYVYLAARSAFVEQSVCALEVSRTLGLGPWASFLRVALPLARPSIAAGVLLVLMETLAEFGAVQFCAVDTFATGIYRTFTLPNQHALTAAAQLSSCLLLLALLLLAAERAARRAARFHHTSTRYRALPTVRLRRWRAGLATSVCTAPIVLGFVVPSLVFALGTLRYGDQQSTAGFLEMSRNSFLLGALASAAALLLATSLLAVERRRATPLLRTITRFCSVGYAIPGAVMAIGIVIALTWVDRRIHGATAAIFGSGPGLLLSGSLFAVLYGYQVRFLAVPLQLVRAGFERIKPSLDAASSSLGQTPLSTLRRVHLPLLRGSLWVAALLVFVDVVKELPATLILRPFGFETLAVRVYQLASDERLSEASTGALAIILVGLVPVLVLSRALERARPGSLSPPAEQPQPPAPPTLPDPTVVAS